MNEDETRDKPGSNKKAATDADEVRQRVVRAFAQMVGDAMSADWTQQSLEMVQGAAADETPRQQDAPAWDAPAFFVLPPAYGFRRHAAEEIPVIGVGSFTSRLRKALQTQPYPYRRLRPQTSLIDGLPDMLPRPRLSPRLRRLVGQLYGANGSFTSGTNYDPFSNPGLLGNAGFKTIGVPSTDVDLTPLNLSSARLRRLGMLFSDDPYGLLRSPLENTDPWNFGRLPISPMILKPRNNQEVADGDDNGTNEEQD